MVGLRARACPWRQPAHGAARAERACGYRQGAVLWPRPGPALDDAAASGIRDDLVTHSAAPERLRSDEIELIWRAPGSVSPLPQGEVDLRSKSGEGFRSIDRTAPPHPDCTGRCCASPGAIRPLPAGER